MNKTNSDLDRDAYSHINPVFIPSAIDICFTLTDVEVLGRIPSISTSPLRLSNTVSGEIYIVLFEHVPSNYSGDNFLEYILRDLAIL